MKVRFPRLLLIASSAIVFAGVVFSIAQHARAQGKTAADTASVANAERKLEHLESNGARTNPDPSPTTFTEREINAYIAAGNVTLPAGVQSATFQEQPQVVIATSRVDFDQIKSGKNSYNPLLSVFSGVHDVVATAHAHGAHGQGICPHRFRFARWRGDSRNSRCSFLRRNTLGPNIQIWASTRNSRCQTGSTPCRWDRTKLP